MAGGPLRPTSHLAGGRYWVGGGSEAGGGNLAGFRYWQTRFRASEAGGGNLAGSGIGKWLENAIWLVIIFGWLY